MNDKLKLIAYTSWYQISLFDDISSSSSDKCLWLSRLSYNIMETAEPLAKDDYIFKIVIDSIIGIFQFYGSYYLSFVLKSELVADVFLDEATLIGKDSSKIYMIKTVRTIPLDYNPTCPLTEELRNYIYAEQSNTAELDSSSSHSNQSGSGSVDGSNNGAETHQQRVFNTISNLNHLLSNGYYYSYDTDLTRSLQNLSLSGYLPLRTVSIFNWDGATDTNPTLIDICDWNFNWATGLFNKIPRRWLTPIIQGYVGYSTNYGYGTCVEFLMIARRSTLRSGTRYTARGIDEFGNAGNFAETELRVRIGASGRWKSFCQARGSIPVCWYQECIRSYPVITSTSRDTQTYFKLHLGVLQSLYGNDAKIILLNLLDVKDSEKPLTDELEHQVNFYGRDDVVLINYNFNAQVRWTNLHQILTEFVVDDLMVYLEEIGHFDNDPIIYEHGDERGMIQRGVFRTNCLDSLDRTNAVQSVIAWVWFSKLIDPDGSLNLLTFPRDDDYIFQSFSEFWCCHGDLISIHYSGTPSIYSAHVKQGRASYSSYLHYLRTSINRLYSCYYDDSSRQELFNIILGVDTYSNYFSRMTPLIDVARGEFEDLKIWCGTWNISGKELSTRDDWFNWVALDKSTADIYVFCIQEFIDLTPINVAVNRNDYNKEQLFIFHIEEILRRSSNCRFKQVKSVTMIGLFLVVYIKEQLYCYISDIDTTSIKTGLLGYAGNKGGVGIKFTLYGLILSFLNLHLNSGRNPNIPRETAFNQIVQTAFRGHNEVTNLHHFYVIGGDFNFKIDLDRTYLDGYIRSLQHTKMLPYDELIRGKAESSFLKQFHEADITFLPTYKYNYGTGFYNSKRKPAWCDRILYGGLLCKNSKYSVTSMYYKRHDNFYTSDHKPVSSMLSLRVVKDGQTVEDEKSYDGIEPLIEF